jgi:DNA/RNA endonuclease YhcR with UshA esterase domain
VVLFEKALKTFSYDPLTLKGKQVCITGKVILYKEKPEIVLYDEKDLKVVD